MGVAHNVKRDPGAYCKTLCGHKIGGAKKPPDRMKNAMMEGEFFFVLLFETQNSFDIIAGL